MDAPTTFGERIRRRRTTIDLSQEGVAERMAEHGAGVSYQTVGKWEKDEARPLRDKLPALAAALGLDEETIVSWWADLEQAAPDESGLRVTARVDGKPLPLPPRLQRQLELLVSAEMDTD